MAASAKFALLVFFLAIIAAISADSRHQSRDLSPEYRKWQEFKEFREWKNWKRSMSLMAEKKSRTKDTDQVFEKFRDLDSRRAKKKDFEKDFEMKTRNDNPPPVDKVALMARYIVNQAGWTSVSTISSRKDIESFPFVNVISFSDGPLGNGSGIPYMFLTPLDFTAQDVFKDNRASLMMTLAQGQYCEKENYDPMDPRCARVVITGKVKMIKKDNPEHETAKEAVLGRHPWLANMPADHHFFFAKLKMSSIAVLDTFGGPKYLTVKDYLHPPSNGEFSENSQRYQIQKRLREPTILKYRC